MIPKIIHYCWFGKNPKPDYIKKYMETWLYYCPNYTIKEWNEDNFDVYQNTYCREAYEAGKWAFVSDFARLKVLYDYGGVYMDTDVEVCKSLDKLLLANAFSGFETNNSIPTGIMGSTQYNEWIGYLLSYYDNKKFRLDDGTFDLKTNVQTITEMTQKKYQLNLNGKYQVFGDNYVLYPFEYLCAKSLDDGKVKKTENTYTIHHFAGSWLTGFGRVKHITKIFLVRIIGINLTNKLKKFFRKYL